ncbi:CBS domain-containing protein [Natronospira proteinivora]|uniref:CBS domain-containing protein n=1 Tax=Natronospira proteinivora TaxID=1807133 RepID=A0ABT1G8T0_9GAMM|nr:CBS domain-containing protein [Natronospira proteinivora]MCP1726738.1 CBS domain-containing protein [Natronospira proteinivora]
MEMTLRSILSGKPSKLHVVGLNDTVREAVRIMVAGDVGSVLVMDEGGLRGLFTERDLMRRVVAEGRDPGHLLVEDVMTREIVTVSPDITISQAMALCTERRIRHLPIYDGETLMGMVSAGDLTKAVVQDKQHTIDDLISYIYGGETI